jgi:hypothetical protein
MAMNQHDPEWQRVIATAALAGVTFVTQFHGRKGGYAITTWIAMIPKRGWVEAHSKYQAAKRALEELEI